MVCLVTGWSCGMAVAVAAQVLPPAVAMPWRSSVREQQLEAADGHGGVAQHPLVLWQFTGMAASAHVSDREWDGGWVVMWDGCRCSRTGITSCRGDALAQL